MIEHTEHPFHQPMHSTLILSTAQVRKQQSQTVRPRAFNEMSKQISNLTNGPAVQTAKQGEKGYTDLHISSARTGPFNITARTSQAGGL